MTTTAPTCSVCGGSEFTDVTVQKLSRDDLPVWNAQHTGIVQQRSYTGAAFALVTCACGAQHLATRKAGGAWEGDATAVGVMAQREAAKA